MQITENPEETYQKSTASLPEGYYSYCNEETKEEPDLLLIPKQE